MEPWALALLFAVVAALYASVGLAGATGYLAVMAFFRIDPAAMKGAALLLNGLVSLIGTWVFRRACREQAREVAVITLPAIPMALLGGAIRLPGRIYLAVVGLVLLVSALRMALGGREAPADGPPRRIGLGAGSALGAGVGFASGLTGTGGGIFLLPAFQALGWFGPRRSAGVVAPYVLLSSVAGLAGHLWRSPELPEGLALWGPAAMLGGLLGARAGRDRLDPATLRRILAALLAVAGLKLLLG